MGIGKALNRLLSAFDMRLVRARITERTTEELRLGRPVWLQTAQSEEPQRVWGYVDEHSIDPGGRFHVMLSGPPDGKPVSGRVEIHRIGYEPPSDRRRVFESEPLTVEPFFAHRTSGHTWLLDRTASAVGASWSPALTVEATDSWTSGYYSIDFVFADGTRDRDIAFLVVTRPDRGGDVLLKLSTATYQAYNRWGGHSLYDGDDGTRLYETKPFTTRGALVSFDRPTRSEFFEWEYYYVMWLEKLAREEGFSVAYATNHDVTRDRAFVDNPRVFVSLGHDEYWSKEEFDWTWERIFVRGGNTLFLGANIAYWQVRYVDVNAPTHERGRQLVCYKSANDPICRQVMGNPELHITDRFRAAARRPETMMVGVAYQSNLKHRYVGSACPRCLMAGVRAGMTNSEEEPRFALYVESTDFPFFAETGYEKGERVADVIGHEWDNRDPEAEYGAPGEPREEHCRLWHEERSRIQEIPLEDIRVVLSGKATDILGREGRAESVYFESPAGGRVFSSGTIRWSWGLGKEGFSEEKFGRLNRGLILHFLER